MPGFLLAIFSAVTQFDVCPVGRYNSGWSFWEGQLFREAAFPTSLGGLFSDGTIGRHGCRDQRDSEGGVGLIGKRTVFDMAAGVSYSDGLMIRPVAKRPKAIFLTCNGDRQ